MGGVGRLRLAVGVEGGCLSGIGGSEGVRDAVMGGMVGVDMTLGADAEAVEVAFEGDCEAVDGVAEEVAAFADGVAGLETFDVLLGAVLTAFTDGVAAALRGVVVFAELELFEVVPGAEDAVGFAFDDKAAACWRIGEAVMFRGDEESN